MTLNSLLLFHCYLIKHTLISREDKFLYKPGQFVKRRADKSRNNSFKLHSLSYLLFMLKRLNFLTKKGILLLPRRHRIYSSGLSLLLLQVIIASTSIMFQQSSPNVSLYFVYRLWSTCSIHMGGPRTLFLARSPPY